MSDVPFVTIFEWVIGSITTAGASMITMLHLDQRKLRDDLAAAKAELQTVVDDGDANLWQAVNLNHRASENWRHQTTEALATKPDKNDFLRLEGKIDRMIERQKS